MLEGSLGERCVARRRRVVLLGSRISAARKKCVRNSAERVAEPNGKAAHEVQDEPSRVCQRSFRARPARTALALALPRLPSADDVTAGRFAA